MDFLKTMAGKVVTTIVTAAVTLAVIIAAISWFTMSPGERQAVLSDVGQVTRAIGMFIGWLLLVGVIPWATFFVIGKVGRIETNLAGVALVVVYTGLEATLLAWMYGWSVRGAVAWIFFAAATLVAGLYNLLACDWIAEKVA